MPSLLREAATIDIDQFRVVNAPRKATPIFRSQATVELTHVGRNADKHRPMIRVNKAVWGAIVRLAARRGFTLRAFVLTASEAMEFAAVVAEPIEDCDLARDADAMNDLSRVREFLQASRPVVFSETRF